MKSNGKAKSPTPPKMANRNMPRNVIHAIRNTINETSSSNSISAQVYFAPKIEDPKALVLLVNELIFFAHAVTGISALLAKTYPI